MVIYANDLGRGQRGCENLGSQARGDVLLPSQPYKARGVIPFQKNSCACPLRHTGFARMAREALASSPEPPQPRPKTSWSLRRLLHQLGELLAGIKHAGLHGGRRDAENLRGV